MEKDFWFGKRVLVTGADGFVAASLIKILLEKGAFVVGTIRHKRPLTTLALLGYESKTEMPDIEYTDLLDLNQLRRICDRHQIDTIFHLAASAIVSSAAKSPYSTIDNNVVSTLNILETARINKVERVMVASSDKAYGDHANDAAEPLPYKESYALRGLDVYSSSKVCSDMLAQTYFYQFKLPVAVIRSSNIFGPGDLNFSRLIPKTTMSLLSKKPPIIYKGNHEVLREYIYIDDVVEAYLLLAEKIGEVYGENNSNAPKTGTETYGWSAFNVGSYADEDLKDLEGCKSIRSVTQVINFLSEKLGDIEPVVKKRMLNLLRFQINTLMLKKSWI